MGRDQGQALPGHQPSAGTETGKAELQGHYQPVLTPLEEFGTLVLWQALSLRNQGGHPAEAQAI